MDKIRRREREKRRKKKEREKNKMSFGKEVTDSLKFLLGSFKSLSFLEMWKKD